MTAGARWGAWAALALATALVTGAPADEPERIDVRVQSTGGVQPTTLLTLHARPDVEIQDRTPGARPGAAGGMASGGDTFTDEITLLLPGLRVARPAAVEVGDALVSAVRLFPEPGGTTVIVFVRQPVSYTVARPTATGDIAVALKARTPPPQAHAPGRRPAHFGLERAGEVSVDADSLSYDQATDTLIARGSVSLTRGGVTLRADEVRYERGTSIADARGHVVLIDPEATFEGDAARLDMDDETGVIEDGRSELAASGYSLRAHRVEKGVGATYKVDDGVFTTCRCGGLERPSWSISSRSTDVDLRGLGVAHGAQFRVADVPILWLPVLPFPANSDRQTGFLMPRLGYSNKRGFQWEQPFFWAIDKSQDVTVATDVETSARLGIIGEYRYIWSRESRGAFAGSFFNQAIGKANQGVNTINTADPNVPENRWGFAGHHDTRFAQDGDLYLDLFMVSDDSFLREINSFASTVDAAVAIRTTRYTRSRTGVVKSWSGGFAQFDTTYFQDLVDPSDTTPQRLPQVRAEQRVPLLDDHLVARLAGEGVDFQRGTGFEGLRGDLAPELFLPFHLGAVLNGSVTGTMHATGYHLFDDHQFGLFAPHDAIDAEGNRVAGGAAVFEQPGERRMKLDPDHFRGVPVVRGRIASELSRVYDFSWLGLTRVRHSIEPEVDYLYVPPVATQRVIYRGQRQQIGPGAFSSDVFVGRGYLYDELDAINRRNFFSWGLTSRLVGRGGTPPPAAVEREEAEEETESVGPEMPPAMAAQPLEPTRELVRFSILHGYDLSRDISDNSHMSSIDAGLRLTPSDLLGFAYNTTYNVQRNQLVGQSVGLVLREPWWQPRPGNTYQGPTTLGVTYNQIREQASGITGLPLSAGFTNAPAQDVAGSIYLRLGDYIGFHFVARYDLDGGTFFNTKTHANQTFGPSFLERDYILRLISSCNCWVIEAGVADKSNPDERLYRVQVTLLGLGSFGEGTGRNFIGLQGLQGLGFRRPTAIGGGHW